MLPRKKQLTDAGVFLLNLFRYLSRSVVSLRRNTFGRMHLHLLNRVTWYSKWHRHPHHRKVHYSALALTCLLVGASVVTTLFPNPSGVEAAVATWDFTHDNTKYDYDTNKVSMSGGSASLTNPGSATGASTNINAASGTTTNASASFASANKEYLTIPSNSSLQTGDIDFEIGGWVYLADTTDQLLFQKWGYPTSNREYYIQAAGSKFKFAVSSDGTNLNAGSVTATTHGNFSINTWYYVRAWHDSVNNKIRIQVNNGAVDETSWSLGVYAGTSTIYLGRDAAPATYLNGRLDSWYFQKRISTGPETVALYNNGSGKAYSDLTSANGLDTFKTGLTSWWDFNEESGTRYDSRGTNHLSATADAIIAPPVYGSELALNPGFETAGSGGADVFGNWTEATGDGSLADDLTLFHSGAHAVKLVACSNPITSPQAQVYQVINVTAGASYYYSFWSRGDGTKDARYAVWDIVNSAYIVGISSVNNPTTSYKLFTGQFTAPAGATSVRLYLLAPSVTGNTAYFDDVSVKQITTAAVNNGGFDSRAATGGEKTNITSVSVARTTNVATIVATEHGLKNGDIVTTTGFTDATFNAAGKTVTVVDVNTFTFASSGTDKITTADTGGRIATDVLNSWTELPTGASTITLDTATPNVGAYSAVLNSVLGGGSEMYNSPLIASKKYSLSCYAKAASGTPYLKIYFGNGGSFTTEQKAVTTTWAQYSFSGTAGNTALFLTSQSVGSSLYIDQVVLTSQGPTAEIGVTTNSPADGNYAATFNGTTQYLSLADNASISIGDEDATLFGSFFLDKINTTQIVFSKQKDSTNREYRLGVTSLNVMKFTVFSGGTSTGTEVASTITANISTWYTFFAWHDSVANKIWISVNNETPVSTDFSGGLFDGNAPLEIGRNYENSFYYAGRVSGLGIIKRIMTADERTSYFNNGKALKYSQLPESMKNSLIRISGDTLNGNFEATPGSGGSPFTNWIKATTGSSSVNDETNAGNVYSGGHSVRLDIDSSGGLAIPNQQVLMVGRKYKATAYIKVSSGTGSVIIGSAGGGSGYQTITATTAYAKYETYFIASSIPFGIYNGAANCNSKSIYIDNVVLEEVPLISYWDLDEKSGVRYDAVASTANNLTDNATVLQALGVNYLESTIGAATDLSGNGNSFAQTLLIKRPVWNQLGINGRHSMIFDGTDDYLTRNGDIFGTGNMTVAFVANARTYANSNVVIRGDGKFMISLYGAKFRITSNDGVNNAFSGAIVANTNYIVTVTRSSDGTVNAYLNGVLSGTADQASGTPSVGGATTNIGSLSGTDRFFDGNIANIQVYNSILDPLHRNTLEKTLGAKYGISVADDVSSSSAVSSFYPTLSLNQSLQYATISSFAPTLSGSSTGIPRYQLTTDGTSAAGSSAAASYYYHNGSAWVSANKYNAYQSNTASEIDSNIATLKTDIPSGGANFVKWRAFLITDGIDNPSITSINSNYISDTKAPLNPATLTSTITPLDSNTPQAISTNEWHNSTTLHLTWPASRNSNEAETDANRGGAIDQINENEIYSGVSSYNLYFGEDPSADPTTTSGLINTNSSPHNQVTTTIDLTNLPLETGKTYYFLIETKDVAGNIAHINQRAAEEPPVLDTPLLTYKYDSTLPTPIEYVQVAQVGCSTSPTFDLTWPASTDSLSGLKYYQYKVGVNGTVNTTTNTTVTVAPERENENVFYVRPVDIAGNSNPTQANTIWQSTVFCSTQSVTLTSGPTYTKTLSTLTVDFETSRPTTSKVEVYKTNQDNTLEKVSTGEDTALSLTHSVIVPNLTPDTNYKYKLFFKDQNNNEGESNYYIAQTDLISLSHTTTNNLENSLSSLTIIFETTKPAKARVEVYKDTNKQQEVSTQDYTLNHHLTINNLTSGTTYTYKIFYIDQENNNYESSTYTTTTTTVGIVDLPTITSGPNSVNVTWKTNLPTTGQVQIKEGDTYKEPQGHISYLSDHNVTIQGLKSEKPYKLRIIWTDESNKTDQTGWFDANTASAPTVKYLKAEVLSPDSVLTSWETNYSSSCVLFTGIGEPTDRSPIDGVATVFSKRLTGLLAGSTYQIKASCTTTGDVEFVSVVNAQTPPLPAISALRFEPLKEASHATYKAFWTTNIETSSAIYYKVQGGGEYKSKASAELTKEHEILLDSMEDQATYELYAQGADKYGNVTKSDLNTIKTPNDSRPPKITNLSTSVKSSGFADNQKAQVIVTWDTDELTTSQVEYANGIEGTEYQNRTKEETAPSTSHVVVISDLEPSKIYHLRAISKDQANNPAYSQDTTVITGKVQKSVLDIILASLQRSLGWITKLFK